MFTVFGFYKFKQINNLNRNKKLLNNLLLKKNIRGTIIISREESMDLYLEKIKI